MDRIPKGMLPIKIVLDQALREHGMEKRLREQTAVVIWEDIVGKTMAKNTKAVRIERGTLLIEVKSSAWKQQLQMLKPQILDKLNRQLGKGTVKDLRFK